MTPIRKIVARIKQDELETLLGLQNQIHAHTQMYNRLASDVLRRLSAGADVDPGTHIAELEFSAEGPVHSTRLVVR